MIPQFKALGMPACLYKHGELSLWHGKFDRDVKRSGKEAELMWRRRVRFANARMVGLGSQRQLCVGAGPEGVSASWHQKVLLQGQPAGLPHTGSLKEYSMGVMI